MLIIILLEIIFIQFYELIGVVIAILISRIFGWIYIIIKAKKELQKVRND